MNVFLVVAFLISGIWVDGDPADGWGPVPMTNMTECNRVLDQAAAIAALQGNSEVMKFRCVPAIKLLTF